MAAGSAASSGSWPASSWPCPDYSLLAQVKRSPAYRQVRRRLPAPTPTDAWEVDGIAYFAWDLWPAEEAGEAGGRNATVLFMVHVGARRLVAATIVTPSANGGEPEVVALPVMDEGVAPSPPA